MFGGVKVEDYGENVVRIAKNGQKWPFFHGKNFIYITNVQQNLTFYTLFLPKLSLFHTIDI